MKTPVLFVSFVCALLSAGVAAAAECRGEIRVNPPKKHEVDNLEVEVTRARAQLAAAEDKVKTTRAARDAAVQQLSNGTVEARARAAATSTELEAAQLAWERAKEAEECANREFDDGWLAWRLHETSPHAIVLAPSLAGGAGGTYRMGGSLLVTMRDTVYREFDFGIGSDWLRERSGADGLFSLGGRARVYFGESRAAFFLGLYPELAFRTKEPFALLTGQLGVRIRSAEADFLGAAANVKLYAEPRIPLDGSTPVALFFGVEIGVAFGWGKDSQTWPTRWTMK